MLFIPMLYQSVLAVKLSLQRGTNQVFCLFFFFHCILLESLHFKVVRILNKKKKIASNVCHYSQILAQVVFLYPNSSKPFIKLFGIFSYIVKYFSNLLLLVVTSVLCLKLSISNADIFMSTTVYQFFSIVVRLS